METKGGGDREREAVRVPAPRNAVRWSSVNLIALSSDTGWWYWTHSAVPLGSQVMNCSSTTVLRTPSKSQPSTSHQHHQVSWSCWLYVNSQPTSSSVSARKCWRCCLVSWPMYCRMACFRSSYTSLSFVGSCWTTSWASLVRSGFRRATRCPSSCPHASMACSKSARKASGSSYLGCHGCSPQTLWLGELLEE